MSAFSKDRWPAYGDVRALLEYLDELHRDAGRPTYPEIGEAVRLAPSTLSPFFTGVRLISKGNLELVVDYLGGDTVRAERLRKKAAAEWNDRPKPADGDRAATSAVPTIRSFYEYMVRRVAPATLEERESELAELAAFCTEPGPSAFVWWRAPAWAGKSALMSWFVLHPPPGTRVVSFFITARYRGQDDWRAFIDAVLDQLSAVLHRRLASEAPAETIRDGFLLGIFAEAAEVCRQRGDRLVLVVDGLDEDRGVTAGPDACSIGALLPADPPAGMRVVVSGRLDPPIPRYLPDRHPLRDPGIVQLLTPSPFAWVVRVDLERELDRLLDGAPAEQDLLGLVAAAGGGLSGADLAKPTGLTERQVQKHLFAVAGRSFAHRPSHWQPGIAPDVYVLAHEDLQATATRSLGEARLADYRERLHTWAGYYLDRGWPDDTPEYLLRGYFRLLHETGDLARMTELAIDRARHQRLLDLTGGDGAALAEIVTVQDVLLGHHEPDLLTMARLAVHRDRFTARNVGLPGSLPAVWGKLDHAIRAEGLAQSILLPPRTDRSDAKVLVDLVEAVATTGDYDWAEELARSISSEFQEQEEALARVARIAAEAGDISRAAALAGEVEATFRADNRRSVFANSFVLAELARAVAATGDSSRATALAHEAEDVRFAAEEGFRSFLDKEERRKRADAARVRSMADAGEYERAENLARSLESGWRETGLADLARAAAGTRNGPQTLRIADQVEAAVRTIDSVTVRAAALADLARALVNAGEGHRARKLALEAEELIRSSAIRIWRTRALTDLGQAVAYAGSDQRATARGQLISLSASRRAEAEADDDPGAAGRAAAADELVRYSIPLFRLPRPDYRDHDDLLRQVQALASRAKDAQRAEDLRRAADLARSAEQLILSATDDPYRQATALVELAVLPDCAARVVAQALRLAGLTSPKVTPLLDALIRIEPAAASAVADELLSLVED